MNRLLCVILLLVSLQSCKERPGVVVAVHNPGDTIVIGEVVELDYTAVMDTLDLNRDTTIVILEHSDTQVPYRIEADGMMYFVAEPIPAHLTGYYRIVPGVSSVYDDTTAYDKPSGRLQIVLSTR
ncbi:MAG: hypothetical protein J6U43_01680 [Bacteroidales bacterium]|nr:hypothetical protein [Bacteroidales bacterium]